MDFPQLRIKIVLLGEGGVGKTTLSKSFEQNKGYQKTRQTVGIDVHVKRFTLEGFPCVVQLWDLGGQNQFKNMGAFSKFCAGSHGAIVCFDLTDLNTFNQLDLWLTFLPPETPFILVGTKADLESTDYLLQNTIMNWVKKNHCLLYLETRIDKYDTIHQAFMTLIIKIVKNHLSEIKSFVNNYSNNKEKSNFPEKISNILGDNIIISPK